MDQFGFEKINETLKKSPVGEVEIVPEPEEGENVRFVTIRPLDRTRPAEILNVLDEAGLMHSEGPRDLRINSYPVLKPLGIDAFGITLEDTNRR